MEVGVRELKAKLSSYLARAAAGEIVTVTDRGQVVAVLAPPPRAVGLEAASAAGWLTRATGGPLRPVRRFPGTGTVLSALAEDRSE